MEGSNRYGGSIRRDTSLDGWAAYEGANTLDNPPNKRKTNKRMKGVQNEKERKENDDDLKNASKLVPVKQLPLKSDDIPARAGKRVIKEDELCRSCKLSGCAQ